jgi:hypothetical protein
VEQARVPVTVMHIRGEINTNTYEQLQIRADEVHDAGARDILLDLTNVPYVSSAGLRAIHYIFTLLRTSAAQESDEAMSKGLRDGTFKSPHLKLLNPTDAVCEVLKVSGFDMYLDIHRNMKEALVSF